MNKPSSHDVKPPMTARTATVRLYVAFASLLAAVLGLIVGFVRLAASLTVWAASAVEKRRAAGEIRGADRAAPVCARGANRPRLALVPALADAPSKARELTTALTGLGFRAPEVRRFVSSLDPARVEGARIEVLIKEGLGALGRKVG